jgi:uncharacterized protein (UPF0335 family)
MNTTHPITTDCDGDGDCKCGDDADTDNTNTNETMTDNDNPFTDVSNLTVDAVREQSEAVDERIETLEDEVHELADAQETVDELRLLLDTDEDKSIVTDVKETRELVSQLRDDVAEYKEAELTELRETVVDNADYDDDEVADMGEDQLTMLIDAMDRLDVGDDGDSEEDGSVKTPTNDSHESSSGFDGSLTDVNPIDSGMAGGSYGDIN